MRGLTSDEHATTESAAGEPMLGQVQAWSALNSGSRNLPGLAAMARILADQFSALPGQVELKDAHPVEIMDSSGTLVGVEHGQNLHVRVRAEAPVQVLLTGHMDTVFAADHPFQAVQWLEAGILGGPGVSDMKGGIAVMLAALTALERSPAAAALGYEVVINSDEEIGSPGSSPLIAAAAAGKRAAFTYEPAAMPDGTFAGARPGSGNFSILVEGRSAHAGRNPEDGRNAVVAASDLAVRLWKIRDDGLSVNPAKIDGGGPNNVVPDRAVLRVNMRAVSLADQARAETILRETMANIASEHEVVVHLHGGFARPPKPLDPEAVKLFELVRGCGAALGQAISWQPTGGVCDGNNIAACGVPVVDTMGVRGGAIHSSDEYLIVDSLAERARLSALALLRLANGEGL